MKGVCGGGQQQQSLTPVVGIVILLAITVILVTVVSGVFLGVSDQLREPAPTFTSERGVAVSTNGTNVSNTLVLEHRGGEPVDATGLSVVVNTKSESRRVPVPLSGDLADGRWTADEQLRLPLNQTDVCVPGSQVEFVLTQETDSEYGYVLREFTVPIARDQFAIRNGAVVPTTGYEADVEVIGADHTVRTSPSASRSTLGHRRTIPGQRTSTMARTRDRSPPGRSPHGPVFPSRLPPRRTAATAAARSIPRSRAPGSRYSETATPRRHTVVSGASNQLQGSSHRTSRTGR